MLLNIILWIIVGGIAGWVASIIMRTNDEQGVPANIIVGIIGALIGGWIAQAIFNTTVSVFSLSGLIVAIVGAIILLAVLRALGFMGGRGITHNRGI